MKGWIVDQVEGFVWPSADVDALREAASAWQYAAGVVADLPDYCRAAADRLQDEVSPEVPLALDALAELSDLATDVQADLAALAQSCDEYADRVEGARQAMHAVLDGDHHHAPRGRALSGRARPARWGRRPLGGAVGVTEKIAPKHRSCTRSRSHSRRVPATPPAVCGSAGQSLAHSQQGQLSKFVRARARLRDERGSLGSGGAGGVAGRWRFPSLRQPGWITGARDRQEGPHPGRHVGKSDEYLLSATPPATSKYIFAYGIKRLLTRDRRRS